MFLNKKKTNKNRMLTKAAFIFICLHCQINNHYNILIWCSRNISYYYQSFWCIKFHGNPENISWFPQKKKCFQHW